MIQRAEKRVSGIGSIVRTHDHENIITHEKSNITIAFHIVKRFGTEIWFKKVFPGCYYYCSMKHFSSSLPVVLFLFLVFGSFTNAQSIPEQIQKGASLINEGKLEDAKSILTAVIQQEPKHGPARFLLAQIAVEQQEWKEAEEHLKTAVTSNVRRPHLAWQLLGKLQLMQHRYPDAGTSFDESIKQMPDFLPAWIGKTQVALFSGQIETAMMDLQKISGKSPEATILFAEVLIYMDRRAEAEQQLKSGAFQDSPLANASRSIQLALSNDPSAGNQLRALIAQNLGDPQVYLALGIFEQRNQRNGQALYQIAFQLDDQNPMPLLFLKKSGYSQTVSVPKIPYMEVARNVTVATGALKEGNLEVAMQHAEQILKDRPMHIPSQIIAIEAAGKQNNNWDALQRYTRITNSISGIPSIESRLAALAEKMGALDLAECSVKRAIEVDPQNGAHHHLLATILRSKNDIDAAIRENEQAISLGFETAPAYETLGNLYYEKMEVSKSIAALRKAVELDPQTAENIASFALSALTSEDYAALREILEKHVQNHPNNVNSMYKLALIYLNENKLEQAEQYLVQLEKLAPEHEQVPYNLALVKSRLGKTNEAEQAMARFEKIKNEQRIDFDKHTEASKIRLQAEEAYRANKMEESIRLYSQLLSERRVETKDLITLAKSYAALKKNADSLRIYELALQSSPYNTEALEGAAQAAKATGNLNAAKLHEDHAKLLTQTCL